MTTVYLPARKDLLDTATRSKCTVVYLCETIQQVRAELKRTFHELEPHVETAVSSPNTSQHDVVLKNGSRIMFRSLGSLDGLRGIYPDYYGPITPPAPHVFYLEM